MGDGSVSRDALSEKAPGPRCGPIKRPEPPAYQASQVHSSGQTSLYATAEQEAICAPTDGGLMV